LSIELNWGHEFISLAHNPQGSNSSVAKLQLTIHNRLKISRRTR